MDNDVYKGCPLYQLCDQAVKEVAELKKAFPNEDIPGHHDYHSAKIRAAQAEEKFWNDLKDDLKKRGILGIVTVLVGLMIYGAYAKIKIMFGGLP